MSSLFLSHSHRDKVFVRRLGEDLRARGLRVWIDEAEMAVGESLLDRIESAIAEMDFLAVVLSPDSVGSPWVKEELKMALMSEINLRRVRVLPILLRDCDLPGFLQGKVFADFREEANYQSALLELVRSVQRHSEHALTKASPGPGPATAPVPDERSLSFTPESREPIREEAIALGATAAFGVGYWQANHLLHVLMAQTEAETPLDAYLGLVHVFALGVPAVLLYAFGRHRPKAVVTVLVILPVVVSLVVSEWRGRHSVSAMAFLFMQAVIGSLLVLAGALKRQFAQFRSTRFSTIAAKSSSAIVLKERALALWVASLAGAILVVVCGALMPVALYLAPSAVFTWPIQAAERQLLAILFGMTTLVLFAECALVLWPRAQVLRAESALFH